MLRVRDRCENQRSTTFSRIEPEPSLVRKSRVFNEGSLRRSDVPTTGFGCGKRGPPRGMHDALTAPSRAISRVLVRWIRLVCEYSRGANGALARFSFLSDPGTRAPRTPPLPKSRLTVPPSVSPSPHQSTIRRGDMLGDLRDRVRRRVRARRDQEQGDRTVGAAGHPHNALPGTRGGFLRRSPVLDGEHSPESRLGDRRVVAGDRRADVRPRGAHRSAPDATRGVLPFQHRSARAADASTAASPTSGATARSTRRRSGPSRIPPSLSWTWSTLALSAASGCPSRTTESLARRRTTTDRLFAPPSRESLGSRAPSTRRRGFCWTSPRRGRAW